MLSTIEKVIILKTVDLFSATPEDVLAEVADLLVEQRVPNDTQIFAKDDPGDSMYIIVVGEVRVHDGATTLNYLGERMIFGEMALLDAAPRVASVTTVDDTLLLRLDQEPFFELMDDRIEIARGIIRVLTGHLRNRVRDLAAELRNHKTSDATQTHSTVLKPSMR
jgi:CRP-like cAMP-binding protein